MIKLIQQSTPRIELDKVLQAELQKLKEETLRSEDLKDCLAKIDQSADISDAEKAELSKAVQNLAEVLNKKDQNVESKAVQIDLAYQSEFVQNSNQSENISNAGAELTDAVKNLTEVLMNKYQGNVENAIQTEFVDLHDANIDSNKPHPTESSGSNASFEKLVSQLSSDNTQLSKQLDDVQTEMQSIQAKWNETQQNQPFHDRFKATAARFEKAKTNRMLTLERIEASIKQNINKLEKQL